VVALKSSRSQCVKIPNSFVRLLLEGTLPSTWVELIGSFFAATESGILKKEGKGCGKRARRE
jgi:hypothetical protein